MKVINFLVLPPHSCVPNVDGSQGPKAIANDDCTLMLSWDTDLVCQSTAEPLQCIVSDPQSNL